MCIIQLIGELGQAERRERASDIHSDYADLGAGGVLAD